MGTIKSLFLHSVLVCSSVHSSSGQVYSEHCSPHKAPFITTSAEGLEKKGRKSIRNTLCVMTSNKDKVVKDPFFLGHQCTDHHNAVPAGSYI